MTDGWRIQTRTWKRAGGGRGEKLAMCGKRLGLWVQDMFCFLLVIATSAPTG